MTTISVRKQDAVATLVVSGRFDFSAHQEFRSQIKQIIADGTIRSIEIDLSAVDYIDSAALGMLLLSRENAAVANMSVAIVRPAPVVRQVLDIANFQRLFDIR